MYHGWCINMYQMWAETSYLPEFYPLQQFGRRAIRNTGAYIVVWPIWYGPCLGLMHARVVRGMVFFLTFALASVFEPPCWLGLGFRGPMRQDSGMDLVHSHRLDKLLLDFCLGFRGWTSVLTWPWLGQGWILSTVSHWTSFFLLSFALARIWDGSCPQSPTGQASYLLRVISFGREIFLCHWNHPENGLNQLVLLLLYNSFFLSTDLQFLKYEYKCSVGPYEKPYTENLLTIFNSSDLSTMYKRRRWAEMTFLIDPMLVSPDALAKGGGPHV